MKKSLGSHVAILLVPFQVSQALTVILEVTLRHGRGCFRTSFGLNSLYSSAPRLQETKNAGNGRKYNNTPSPSHTGDASAVTVLSSNVEQSCHSSFQHLLPSYLPRSKCDTTFVITMSRHKEPCFIRTSAASISPSLHHLAGQKNQPITISSQDSIQNAVTGSFIRITCLSCLTSALQPPQKDYKTEDS